MSIPAASLLDQVSAGGAAPQTGGNTSSPSANTGIFAALLGNSEGSPATPLEGPTANPDNGQGASNTLPDLIPEAVTSLLAAAETAQPTGSLNGKSAEVAKFSQPMPPGDALDAAMNARPSGSPDLETVQQRSGELVGKQASSNSEEASLAKLVTGKEITLQRTSIQAPNTPPGAQATGTQVVPDQRPTSSLEDTTTFGSQSSKSETSAGGATAGSSGSNTAPHAGLQSSPIRALGGSMIERADNAGAANSIDTPVMAREAAIAQNYNQQLRLAGDEVRAPVKSLAVEITAHARTGVRQFEIRMDPPELGRIDVRLDVKENGTVTTRLVVERAETLDLLQRDSRFLERALSDNGLKLDEGGMRMSLKGDGAGQHAQSGAQDFDEQSERSNEHPANDTSGPRLDDDLDSAPPPIGGIVINGGIDIRV